MATNQQFCLRWNNHQRTLISVFDSLLESGTLVDCTLAAEGQYLKAHKVVLSACSPYLGVLLSTHHEKHPILILKDIKFQELKAMLDYMYKGEVNISQDQLCTFLKAAESLQIKGLTESAALNSESKEFEERVSRKYERKNATPVPLSNHNIKIRSPPINAIVDNSPQAWTSKFPVPNLRPATPPIVRDGSISPVSRKRRKQQHPQPNTEDVSARISENNQEIVQSIDSSSSSLPEQNVSPNPTPVPFLTTNNIKSEAIEKPSNTEIKNTNITNDENLKPIISNDVTVKTEPIYCDPRQLPDSLPDAAYDDSMEEMTLDEEEEIDENDISRPGPSNSEDSQPYNSSYPVSCDSDGVSSGQVECQGGMDVKSWKLRYMSSWESWSAAHPNVPVSLSPQTSSSPPTSNNNYASSSEYHQKEGVECPDCGRHYKLKSSLRNHQKWECGKEPQFQCPYCNYRAKQKMHVARHIERMHREKLTLTESSCILNNNNINNSNNNNNNNSSNNDDENENAV